MIRRDEKQFLEILKFVGKRSSCRKVSAKRGVAGIRIINKILQAPTYESVCFALEIIKCLYAYESLLNISRYSLEKALVSLCDRVFVEDVYMEIEERIKNCAYKLGRLADGVKRDEGCEIDKVLDSICYDDPLLDEVIVGYSILRFRRYGIFWNGIIERIKNVSGKMRMKAKNIFGRVLDGLHVCELESKILELVSLEDFLSKKPECVKEKLKFKLSREDEEYMRENYPLVSYFYNIPEDINIPYRYLRKNFSVGYFTGGCPWDKFIEVDETSFNEVPHETLDDVRDICFCLHRRREYNLNLMCKFAMQAGAFERAFMKGYIGVVEQRFVTARDELKNALRILIELGIKSIPEVLLSIYDLLALSHLFCGEYFECMFYLEKGMSMSHRNRLHFVTSRFLDYKFIVERIGRIQGPSPRIELLSVHVLNTKRCVRKEGENFIVNNKILVNLLLEEEMSNFREVRTVYHFTFIKIPTFYNDIQRIIEHFPEYAIISLYCIDGCLFVNDFEKFIKINGFSEILRRFHGILNESRAVLEKTAVSDVNKRTWWDVREKLNSDLEDVLNEISAEFCSIKIGRRVILVLDETTTEFPFESMPIFREKIVYRVPSLECLEDIGMQADEGQAGGSMFYLLDPDNDFPETQKNISEFLNSVGVKNGIVGRPPSTSELRKADCCDIILYFGHGSGLKHLKLEGRNKTMLLFGCNSAKLLCVRNYKRNGSILKHLYKNYIILGCLWEVTDKDIDRFSVKIIEGMKNGNKSLGELVSKCRNEFRMRHLNGASVVVYGSPKCSYRVESATLL